MSRERGFFLLAAISSSKFCADFSAMRSKSATTSGFQRIEIGHVFDDALLHKLIHDFFARHHIHGVAPGEMEQ